MRLVVERSARRLLVLLLAADAVFVGIHALHAWSGIFSSGLWAIDKDRGFAETYGYVQEYWAACVALALAWNRRSVRYASWALVFGYLLLDDAATIHELLGGRLADAMSLPAVGRMRPKDLGEALVGAGLGGTVLVAVALAYLRADPAFQAFSRRVVVVLLALVGFGIGVDLLHALLGGGVGEQVFVLLEDGGEMAVTSLLVATVFDTWVRT